MGPVISEPYHTRMVAPYGSNAIFAPEKRNKTIDQD